MRILSAISDSPVIDALGRIFPPSGIVEIGAALPLRATLPDWTGKTPILLVESLPDWAEKRELPDHISRVRAVLSGQPTDQVYHVASLLSESGRLPPEKLQPFWQNIKLDRTLDVSTQTLDHLLSEQSGTYSWLLIDDLQGHDILVGADATIKQADVIVLRCHLNHTECLVDQASCLDSLTTYAQTIGMRRLKCLPSRHAEFVYLVLVRDYRTPLSEDQEKHALLAENNLKDLQAQHRALSDAYLQQAKQLEQVQSLLHLARQLAQAGGGGEGET